MTWRSSPIIPDSTKVSVELQQNRLPVPVLQVGGLFLRTGVVEAVTLPAKAMAATKETRDLLNSIVKKEKCRRFSVFSRTLRNLEGYELPFYKISSKPGGKIIV